MNYRGERLAGLIKEELSKIILREVEFPGFLVTVTDVSLSKEGDSAIVGFSVIPTEKAEKALKLLNARRGHLNRLLIEKINIKPSPRVSFRIDIGLAKAAGVEKALIKEENRR